MTELQVTINNIKEVLIAGDLIVKKLEKAQKDLEKPPEHKWKHMDVFMGRSGAEMIFITCAGEDKVYCIDCCIGHGETREWTENAKFLFNIKEKL